MSIQPDELKTVANKVLRLLGVTDYSNLELTYALKENKKWKVNFSYTPILSFVKKEGCFKIDAESGEIEGMWLDRAWQ